MEVHDDIARGVDAGWRQDPFWAELFRRCSSLGESLAAEAWVVGQPITRQVDPKWRDDLESELRGYVARFGEERGREKMLAQRRREGAVIRRRLRKLEIRERELLRQMQADELIARRQPMAPTIIARCQRQRRPRRFRARRQRVTVGGLDPPRNSGDDDPAPPIHVGRWR